MHCKIASRPAALQRIDTSKCMVVPPEYRITPSQEMQGDNYEDDDDDCDEEDDCDTNDNDRSEEEIRRLSLSSSSGSTNLRLVDIS